MIEAALSRIGELGAVPVALDSGPLLDLPLPEIWFATVFFMLFMFLFLDGFDFGVGVLFAFRDDHHERETLLAAIGPFWDGNEVWLVVFGGALFAAFPEVYANLFSRHYLLMFGILGALMLRGLSPEFYEQREDDRWQTWWGRAFVVGSVASPFFLGMFATNWLVGATTIITVPGVVVGLAVVALTVVDGAAFLRLKIRGPLREDAATYGLRALGGYVSLLVVGLVYLGVTRPDLRESLLSPLPVALVVASLAFATAYTVTMRAERHYLTFGSAAGLVFSFVSVVAAVMYPMIDPATGLTVRDAIVSTLPLNLMTVASSVLIPLVLLYFATLYSAFSGPVEAEGYGE